MAKNQNQAFSLKVFFHKDGIAKTTAKLNISARGGKQKRSFC